MSRTGGIGRIDPRKRSLLRLEARIDGLKATDRRLEDGIGRRCGWRYGYGSDAPRWAGRVVRGSRAGVHGIPAGLRRTMSPERAAPGPGTPPYHTISYRRNLPDGSDLTRSKSRATICPKHRRSSADRPRAGGRHGGAPDAGPRTSPPSTTWGASLPERPPSWPSTDGP